MENLKSSDPEYAEVNFWQTTLGVIANLQIGGSKQGKQFAGGVHVDNDLPKPELQRARLIAEKAQNEALGRVTDRRFAGTVFQDFIKGL